MTTQFTETFTLTEREMQVLADALDIVDTIRTIACSEKIRDYSNKAFEELDDLFSLFDLDGVIYEKEEREG